MTPIYLDNNASTQPDPFVVEAVARASVELFANPASSQHAPGHQAAQAVEQARAEVAELVDAPSAAVVFTSGATRRTILRSRVCGRRTASKGVGETRCLSEPQSIRLYSAPPSALRLWARA